MPLYSFVQSLTTVTKGFGNRSLVFLGLKIQDAGNKISADKTLANDLFSTLKDIGITLFVLITHNVEEQAGNKCAFVPISSMSDAAYKDKSLPALMEKVVFPVDDKAYRRPGWALFDIQVEIYDDVLCQRNISKPAVFARIIAAKNILEKNRKRTFPPGR
ncbi:unnamed protein product [Ixodes persulcatus]